MISSKIKAALTMSGKSRKDLAEYMGISYQVFNNKMSRNSFSADDLIRISEFLGCKLYLELDENNRISFDATDIRESM